MRNFASNDKAELSVGFMLRMPTKMKIMYVTKPGENIIMKPLVLYYCLAAQPWTCHRSAHTIAHRRCSDSQISHLFTTSQHVQPEVHTCPAICQHVQRLVSVSTKQLHSTLKTLNTQNNQHSLSCVPSPNSLLSSPGLRHSRPEPCVSPP